MTAVTFSLSSLRLFAQAIEVVNLSGPASELEELLGAVQTARRELERAIAEAETPNRAQRRAGAKTAGAT